LGLGLPSLTSYVPAVIPHDLIALTLGEGDGPVALADGVRALQSAQRLLVAAAGVVDERSADTPGRRRNAARAFLRTVRLGDGLTVVVPVEPAEADGLIPREDGCFARQVTAALDGALRAVRDAAFDGGTEALRLSAGLGVTGAMAKALVPLFGERPVPFSVALHWSPERPRPDAGPVRFTPDLADALRRGGVELDRPEVLADVVLRGRVLDLRLTPETAHGTVGIRGHFASDPFQRAHQADVRLPLPAYHRALRAHGKGHAVEVQGALELRRSRWLLTADRLTVIEI
jgi:hypothetical protein